MVSKILKVGSILVVTLTLAFLMLLPIQAMGRIVPQTDQIRQSSIFLNASSAITFTPVATVYLPIILQAGPLPAGTLTATPTGELNSTVTATPTGGLTSTVTATPQTTLTLQPTATPTKEGLSIIFVEYDPVDSLRGEYVKIQNSGATDVDMTRWTLRDSVSNTYTFPTFTLKSQATVYVRVISGTNNAENLYWNRSPVWNDDKDTAILSDATGKEIDRYAYPVATATPQASGTPATPTPTPTPTELFTLTLDIQIIHVEYDPVDAKGEYVDIENKTVADINMTGWTLSDASDAKYTFLTFTLKSLASVRVWVLTGTNDATNLYWGRKSGIWNNDGDTATLRDATGKIMARLPYVPVATPTPTAKPSVTVTPLPTGSYPTTATVKITYIEYAPLGSDLDGEHVVIKNFDAVDINLTHWTLSDSSDTIFRIPTFTLPSLATVTVWVKKGTDDPTNLYWGSTRAIWNNDGDTAFLKDTAGTEIHRCTYSGGQEGIKCE